MFAYAALQWLGRTYGSTRQERDRGLPGDELTVNPMAVTTHTITINAPAAQIWPWLVQMGWHRGGWYTAEWVDRLLFPANGPSAERVIPELQHLAVGDRVPDGPPETECEFVVAELEPNHHLVLHSANHLPPAWKRRFGAWIDWTWAFVLADLSNGRTRFIVRSRLRAGPRWVAAAYLLAIVPADFIMSRQMLHGIKARAERTTAEDLTLPALPSGAACWGGRSRWPESSYWTDPRSWRHFGTIRRVRAPQ
jgi:hypothetical protein